MLKSNISLIYASTITDHIEEKNGLIWDNIHLHKNLIKKLSRKSTLILDQQSYTSLKYYLPQVSTLILIHDTTKQCAHNNIITIPTLYKALQFVQSLNINTKIYITGTAFVIQEAFMYANTVYKTLIYKSINHTNFNFKKVHLNKNMWDLKKRSSTIKDTLSNLCIQFQLYERSD